MTDVLSSNSFFAVALTLLIWRAAAALQKKTGSALLHPILVSAAAIRVYKNSPTAVGTRNAVSIPAITRDRLLTAPCVFPISLALAVPIT